MPAALNAVRRHGKRAAPNCKAADHSRRAHSPEIMFLEAKGDTANIVGVGGHRPWAVSPQEEPARSRRCGRFVRGTATARRPVIVSLAITRLPTTAVLAFSLTSGTLGPVRRDFGWPAQSHKILLFGDMTRPGWKTAPSMHKRLLHFPTSSLTGASAGFDDRTLAGGGQHFLVIAW